MDGIEMVMVVSIVRTDLSAISTLLSQACTLPCLSSTNLSTLSLTTSWTKNWVSGDILASRFLIIGLPMRPRPIQPMDFGRSAMINRCCFMVFVKGCAEDQALMGFPSSSKRIDLYKTTAHFSIQVQSGVKSCCPAALGPQSALAWRMHVSSYRHAFNITFRSR